MLAFHISAWSANTKESVTQVATTVTLSTDVDYVVTGTTPFTDGGVVNMTNTEHAVLILERVKPSQAIPLLANHVQINGVKAVNTRNCQVRLYGTMGSMILPYEASTFKPLTVYSEQNFKGESSSDFGLENDGGYMVSMTDQQLNNRIRSFRLKRGYMVTFATQKSGYGYQRCFIANSEDIEMATLPQILDEKISSYRVFKWNTAGKKGLASSTDASACDALNIISCYGWNVGKDMQPDVECVANHLYEDYPSSSACGKATWTCHLKTNNEPRNSADDQPQSLSTILNNWQNLMRTGMRLCSPSSWDGSDYTDGSGFIKQFLDSIDARGWRCDLVDLHCYWLIDNFNNLSTMQSKYKRPIWISEWIWGASWNKNGAFESGKTDGDIAWGVKQICEKLNSYGFVERYFYWNSETKGKLYNNGSLTEAGKYYSSMLSGMGYNKSYEKVPNTPRMRGGFTNFRVVQTEEKATISWHDYDGEYNQLMEVLRKHPGQAWQTWKTVKPEDAEADYILTDENAHEGTRYRLHIRSFSGRDYYSSEDLEPGEAIETEQGLRYVGGNIILNGDFQMGLDGWTSGNGEPLQQPWFEVFPKGLTDGYFLQAFANQGKDAAGSVKTAVEVAPNQDYVIRVASCNAGEYLKIDLRMKGETSDVNKATLKSNNYWSTQQAIFNSGQYNEALLSFRWLAAKGQLGDIELRRLFTTEAEALADGEVWNKKREQLLAPCLAKREQHLTDSLLTVAKAVAGYGFEGREELEEAIREEDCNLLKNALDRFLVLSAAEVQPKSAAFETENGWSTKCGTFTGGDQRLATQEGKTCWNAWWSGVAASEGEKQTLEIQQQLSGLAEGLYALQCKASTQHYCLSDQHGFLKTKREQVVTPMLQRDYLDVPNTIDAWQTLTTIPLYVTDNDTITFGFTSSKHGATDNAWRRYANSETGSNNGDQREGWWCATDFQLLYHPLFSFTCQPGQFTTICLPYACRCPEGVKVYQVAGLLSDYSRLCLQEAETMEAGRPYICVADHEKVIYYPNGEAIKTPVLDGNNNLRGSFKTPALAPEGAYVLKEDGEWYRVSGTRPNMPFYSAFLRKAADIPLYDKWDGLTMIIHDVAEELGNPTGLSSVRTNFNVMQTYTVSGSPSRRTKGIVIKVNEGKASKHLVY